MLSQGSAFPLVLGPHMALVDRSVISDVLRISVSTSLEGVPNLKLLAVLAPDFDIGSTLGTLVELPAMDSVHLVSNTRLQILKAGEDLLLRVVNQIDFCQDLQKVRCLVL